MVLFKIKLKLKDMKFSQIFVPSSFVLSVLIILAIQNTVHAAKVHFHKLSRKSKSHPHSSKSTPSHSSKSESHKSKSASHNSSKSAPHSLPPGVVARDAKVYSVRAFGAAGDSVTDDTQAFNKAWDAACQAERSSVVFLLFLINIPSLHRVSYSKGLVNLLYCFR